MLIITISEAWLGESLHCLPSTREDSTNFSSRLNGPWQGKAVVINSVEEESLSISKSTLNKVYQVAGFRVSKFSSIRWLTCHKLITDKYFTCNITHQKFDIINHSGEDLLCHLQNIIYLSCKNLLSCNYQYVGDATIRLHKWMNIQRKPKTGCEHVIEHFRYNCPGSPFNIPVIEVFKGSGYKYKTYVLRLVK